MIIKGAMPILNQDAGMYTKRFLYSKNSSREDATGVYWTITGTLPSPLHKFVAHISKAKLSFKFATVH